MIKHTKYNNLLQFDLLNKNCNIFHFTTTCLGGVSDGNYDSFNLGEYSGDVYLNVQENRARLCRILNIDIDNLFLPYQTHSDQILLINQAFEFKSIEEKKNLLEGVDAIITNKKGICVGVTTADCVPLIIYDPVEEVLAVVHAGWRGTVAHIAPKVVNKMAHEFGSQPKDLLVGIGPAISQEVFEVGDEVANSFISAGFDMDSLGKRNPISGKIHIDLCLANQSLLLDNGVLLSNIEVSNLCTYCNDKLFFSARRQTIYSGRMVTGAMLTV